MRGLPNVLPAGVQLGLLERGDCRRLRRLFYRLSPETRYRRFLAPIVGPEQAGPERLLDIDHHDREAVTATAQGEILGVARYSRLPGSDRAEIAVVVADAWQRRGIGSSMVRRLRLLAGRAGIASLTAVVQMDNRPAIELLRRIFPAARFRLEDGLLTAEIPCARE
jgi:ribosomal protein S18 acetylase RimI-like enzyme